MTLYGGRPASEISPSLLGFYRPRLDLHEYVVIAISQSGSSNEVLEATSWARACGAKVVALTNGSESPLVSLLPAEQVILLGAGDECAVPATKTFTASLAWLLALALAGQPVSLAGLPALMEQVLRQDYAAKVLGLDGVSTFYFVGEGVAASVAREGALKFREMLGVAAIPLETSDLLHGSTAGLDRQSALIGLAADDVGASILAQARVVCEDRGARFLGLLAADQAAGNSIAIPGGLAAAFPLLAILPLQLIALELTQNRGRNPDRPEGLSKVTETAVPRLDRP